MKVKVDAVFDSDDLDFEFWFEIVDRAEVLTTTTGHSKKGEFEYKWKER